MTADELDALADVQADVRIRYAQAHAAVAAWEPAPFVPSPVARKAAASDAGDGT